MAVGNTIFYGGTYQNQIQKLFKQFLMKDKTSIHVVTLIKKYEYHTWLEIENFDV